MLPNFLVIGAPRSGTTWIDVNLRGHPDVFMPSLKEVHFFDRHYNRGIKHYESFFKGHSGQPAVGEATPDYMHGLYSTNDIPALIYKHLPDVRLIATLRNPVDRVYSRYLNAKAKFDKNKSVSFEEKLDERPEFTKEGFYFEHLQSFLAHFPRERMLLLLYDDLIDDAEGFLRQIYSFLGVRTEFGRYAHKANINAAAGKRNLGRSRLLWLLARACSRGKLHTAADGIRRLNSVSIEPMSTETRLKLISIYREHNLRLQDLLGRDLSHWNSLTVE
jgi:hypothetical protein